MGSCGATNKRSAKYPKAGPRRAHYRQRDSLGFHPYKPPLARASEKNTTSPCIDNGRVKIKSRLARVDQSTGGRALSHVIAYPTASVQPGIRVLSVSVGADHLVEVHYCLAGTGDTPGKKGRRRGAPLPSRLSGGGGNWVLPYSN